MQSPPSIKTGLRKIPVAKTGAKKATRVATAKVPESRASPSKASKGDPPKKRKGESTSATTGADAKKQKPDPAKKDDEASGAEIIKIGEDAAAQAKKDKAADDAKANKEGKAAEATKTGATPSSMMQSPQVPEIVDAEIVAGASGPSARLYPLPTHNSAFLHEELGKAMKREASYAQTTIERLQREQILLKQENAQLKKDAESHADALAKAREGYVENSVVDAKVAELTKRESKVSEALTAAKSAATSWKKKAKAAEKQAKDDRESNASAIKEQATRYNALETEVLDSCRSILGLRDEDVLKLSASDCIKAVLQAAVDSTTGVRAILQHVAKMEIIPSAYKDVEECLFELPTVVEWMQRSPFHRGATMALSMGLAYFPKDFVLDDVTSGFPSESGEVSIEDVLKLNAWAAPFADRVLVIGDLLPFQASVTAPGDTPPQHQDLATERPFEAARAGTLTTYPVNRWVLSHLRSKEGKDGDEQGSSKPSE